MKSFQRRFFGGHTPTRGTALHVLGAALIAALGAGPAPASAAADKIDICHYDKTLDGWSLSSVGTNGKALERHLAHGDGYPDEAVPDLPGYHFDENCVVMADAPVGSDLSIPYAYQAEYTYPSGLPPFEIIIITGPFAFSGEMMLTAAGVPGEELDFAVATPPQNGSVIILDDTKVCDQDGCTVGAVYEPDCSGYPFPGCDIGTYVWNFGWSIEPDAFTFVASGLGGASGEAIVTLSPAALPPLVLPAIPENHLWYALPTFDPSNQPIFQNYTLDPVSLDNPDSPEVQALLSTTQMIFVYAVDDQSNADEIEEALYDALTVEGCGGPTPCAEFLDIWVYKGNTDCRTAYYDGGGDASGVASLGAYMLLSEFYSLGGVYCQ